MEQFAPNVNDFRVHADGVGTSLQGYITITHAELVEKFGEGEGAGDKTLDEWSVKHKHTGIIATIYDWKNYGSRAEDITDWHIGGRDKKAVEFVKALFPNHKVTIAR